MNHSFEKSLHAFINAWSSSSLIKFKDFLSKDYKAREIREGEIIDFGYEESILGWQQGFQFANSNEAKWRINELSRIPLKEDEMMVILSATMEVEGKNLETANLFFNTFKNSSQNEWKLVRSYIEAGIPTENLRNNTVQGY
ncbi:flavoprotein [Bacillus spongiae]|uniref:Flavoprotein n=1 Tax=Bacillus spongiae TaxID=2683610 RepID=A0ABU8HF29_9BACI